VVRPVNLPGANLQEFLCSTPVADAVISMKLESRCRQLLFAVAIGLSHIAPSILAQYAPNPSAMNYAVVTSTVTSGTLPFGGAGSTTTITLTLGNWFSYDFSSNLSSGVGTYAYSQTGSNTGVLITTRTNLNPTFSPVETLTFTGPNSGNFSITGSYDGYTGSAQGTFTITYLQPQTFASGPPYAPTTGEFNYAIVTSTITSGTLPFGGAGSTSTSTYSMGNYFNYNHSADLSSAVGTYSYTKTGSNTGILTGTQTNISPNFTATNSLTFTGSNTGNFTVSGSYDGYTGSAQGTFQVTYLVAKSEPSSNLDRLINLSTRGFIGTGSQILIAGFVVSGPAAETVLIRADGPSLASLGVAGSISAPQLTIFDSSGNAIATNIGWGNAPSLGSSTVLATVQQASATSFSEVGAFSLPAGSADCAMVAILPPGNYTAQVSGVDNSTGVGLVEVYEIP